MTVSSEVKQHEGRVETVARVRELEQACEKAGRYLAHHAIPATHDGWLLDERTGMTLGQDGVLRCQTKHAGLQPLRFDCIVGDEMILPAASDDRHLRLDGDDAFAVLYAAFAPVRLVFYCEVGSHAARNEMHDLMPWLFERVLALACRAPTDPATADQ